MLGQVFELPLSYNAMKHENLPAEEWAKVHIVHDTYGNRPYRGSGAWNRTGIDARIRHLGLQAQEAMGTDRVSWCMQKGCVTANSGIRFPTNPLIFD